MKKLVVGLIVVAVLGGGAWYLRSNGDPVAASTPGQPPGPGGAGAGGKGRGGPGGMGGRTPMTVELAPASRQVVIDTTSVVGNLIGHTTVDVVPRVAGRIDSISVKLGDRVAKGQQIAKIEDREIKEQITRFERTLDVNKATVSNRESDMKGAEAILGRQKRGLDSGITPRQIYEDAEMRYNTAVSQLAAARAQVGATQSNIEELKITLSNTTVVSPVDGFVSRRLLDPGAFAGANTVILSVVDISIVRLVANLVEKDFKRVQPGVLAEVQVDAFQGETFRGEVSRVAPVFDPATRTASMEIEVPNPGFRLKPGMYARVTLTVERKLNGLTIPRNAVVDVEGKRGVYLVPDGQTARFNEIETGLQDGDRIEVLSGLEDGQRVVTFGALALRDGDRVTLADAAGKGGRGGQRGKSEK
jgi:RND family efflux transporter MFP subunit